MRLFIPVLFAVFAQLGVIPGLARTSHAHSSRVTAPRMPKSKAPTYKSPRHKSQNHRAPKYRAPKNISPNASRRKATQCASCKRDNTGKIKRDPAARRSFQQSHPCPSTGKTSGGCPGYVVDHIRPLKRGGADSPDNMQWQSKAAAKAKDKVE